MPHYLLRAEGVNFSAFIDDTEKLQVIRGGSLALLAAIERFRDNPVSAQGWAVLSAGASIGLFAFEALDDPAAEQVAIKARTLLRGSATAAEGTLEAVLPHATFVVDWVRRTDDFSRDVALAVARNRWRQLQSPSLALPMEDAMCTGPCGLDRLRPSVRDLQWRGEDETAEPKPISAATHARREYGRDQKTGFYSEMVSPLSEQWPNLLETIKRRKFVQDLGRLAESPRLANHVLNQKMAVIYIDGNGFGAIQREFCRDPESVKQFNRRLTALQRELIAALLHDATTTLADDFCRPEDGPIRFETLRFGGDDILWVVPAWVGWWTLQRFFELSAAWSVSFARNGSPAIERPLRHGAGLVFCHHKAAISRVKRLASTLADEEPKNDAYKSLNGFSYEILESFDHIADDVASYRARKSPTGSALDLVLAGDAMRAIANHMRHVTDLPKGKLIQLARLIHSDPSATRELAQLEKEIRGSKRLSEAARSHLDQLLPLLTAPKRVPVPPDGSAEPRGIGPDVRLMSWLHLADLWDYLMPPAVASE